MELSKPDHVGSLRAHTGTTEGLANFLCLLCFPPRRLSQDRRTQNGSASTGKLKYSNVPCRNRSNQIRCEATSAPIKRLRCAATCRRSEAAPGRKFVVDFAVLRLVCENSAGFPWRKINAQTPFNHCHVPSRFDSLRFRSNEEGCDQE